ncbi:MAG TPA: MarR family winged helix-turn-helix transcriptional regulator [Solirubrobacteraceae bacterium]|nr:MarR family winged helix-turn-helix transcriptional regulator [Solirubrobacteraceae bacterium]
MTSSRASEPSAPWVAAQADVLAPDATPANTTPFRSVGFTISTIGYAVARRFREQLAPAGLEPREFALLRAIAAEEGQSQQAVGERLQIPPSRMVAFVDALEQQGLLERRQNPTDRRARALFLTEAGHEKLAAAFMLAMAHERELCRELGAEEREQLLELLDRVARQLGLAPGVHAAHSALADE